MEEVQTISDENLEKEGKMIYISPEAVDAGWFLLAGVLVFFMQTGFALLESGSVRYKNYQQVLLKNVMDTCLGAIIWFVCGYGFAFGNDQPGDPKNNGFIG